MGPSCTPLIFGPGITPHCPAPSWWTIPHIALLAAAALLAVFIVRDRRRLLEIAWAVRHRYEPPSVFCPPVRWDGERWVPDGPQVTVREWFRLPGAERRRRTEEFRAADLALRINAEAEELAGTIGETQLNAILNGRVCDLWGSVPWWCRQ